MERYSKSIAAVVGAIVSMALIWMASTGLAECAVVDGAEVCSIFGFSQSQITGALTGLVTTAFVYFAPPNRG